MKKIISLLFTILISSMAFSQLNREDFTPRSIEKYSFTKNIQYTPLVVDSISSINSAIDILFGPGVLVSNLTYTGPMNSIGSFSDINVYTSAGELGINDGIILTTGSIWDAPGPNNNTFTNSANNLPGDADLNALIPGYYTYDASVIEFDFVPMTDTLIACNFIFASEEYLEWVNSSFNDVFGFFIGGPGFIGLQNLATIQSQPISVNTINDITNSQYFIYNTNDVIEYDGYTTPIEISHPIVPGQTYHFKIAIADAGDMILDAAVFLEANSFLGYASVPITNFTSSTNFLMVQFFNTTNYATSYQWNFGDGQTSIEINPTHTYDYPGVYEVELVARNYYQVSSITQTIEVFSDSLSIIDVKNNYEYYSYGNGLYKFNTKNGDLIKIYSMSGQLIYSKIVYSDSETIDIGYLPKAIYIIDISGNIRLKINNL